MNQLTEKEKAACKKDSIKGSRLNAEEEKLVASAMVKCVMNETKRHERKNKK